jgi:hypothetical protein
MTYRAMLMTLLAGIIGCMTLAVASNQLGGLDAVWAAVNPRTLVAKASVPTEGLVPVNKVYEAKDGTMYFVGDGKNALVRDTDGNVRTLPVSALPH